MAGGFGTRLRPLTMNLPKPMVPMMNRPMMEHIVRLLAKHGMTDQTSLLYYHPDAITSYFGDGSKFGVTMNYIRAEADFGTAGSVRNATEQLGITDRILVISGDVLTDFDLTAAIAFHENKHALATIVLTHVKNPLQYGIVMTNPDQDIVRFLEKPSLGEVFSDTINTGIYILEREAFAEIPYKREFDFSKELFPALLPKKGALAGYIANGYWRDVGNLSEYHEAHMDALAGLVRITLPVESQNGLMAEPESVTEGATFRGSNLIAHGARIEPGARLTNAIIGANCHVESGATIENSVLWDGVRIGRKAHVSHSVACSNVVVGALAIIQENVFIGEGTQIGENAEVLPNVKLWPGKRVEAGSKLSTSLVWEDAWNRELFTNSRISGLSNIELIPELAAKIGASVGALAGLGQRIVISRDSDPGSRVLSRALTSGVMSAGAIVVDMQQTPIPLTRHHLRDARHSAGIHVRKNPIDRRRSDMIFFDSGGYDLPSNKGKSIERYFFGEDFPRAPFDKVGNIEFPAHTGEIYTKRFTNALDVDLISRSHFKLAIDYANGIASTIFPNILGMLGSEVVSINAYLEPTRLTRGREEFERSMRHLANVVKSLGYQIGFVLDAGGERVAVVDEDGQMYTNNALLTLLTKLLFESEAKRGRTVQKIAVPISATSEVEELAQNYGAELIYTKNTHADMMRAASEDGVAFVGGTLGGAIFTDYFFAVDGMFTVAKTLEMLAVLDRNLGDVARDMPHHAQARSEVFCKPDEFGKVMRHTMDHAHSMKKVLIDGIKFYPDFGDSWVLVLPDKERPYCSVLADARTEHAAKDLARKYAGLVEQWRGSGE
ncbi:MAG: sugar phosphate nucleotidyltransferase [Bacteroidota bacterium]|nr:sugar phosphate nucleotidyltransferase [Bacteroidota bacterium]MDP4233562.1 sugar phosphate nucleotidyltransferase [Bacteroidota bacterium]MDP4243663.1 sugar phosphate nucleotidyltransferase [Bacteroidota bacterium]